MAIEGERRRNVRIPVEIPTRYRIARERFKHSIALNIHQNGAFILSGIRPDPGTSIAIGLTIPNTGQTIRVKGSVRWVKDPQPKHEPGIGVEFQESVDFALPVKLFSQYMDNSRSAGLNYPRYLFYPEIQEAKDLNSHLLNFVSNGIIILNKDFTVRNYNARQCARFIPEKQKVIGRPIWEINNLFNLRYNNKTFKDILVEVLAAKSYRIKSVPYEPALHQNDTAKSNNCYLDLELRPIVTASEAISSIIILTQDVSKERQWTSRQKEFEAVLLEQSRHSFAGLIMDALLTSMVNPLSAIQGRMELLNFQIQASKNDPAPTPHKGAGINQIAKGLKTIGHSVQTLTDLCGNFVAKRNKEQDPVPRFLDLNDIIRDQIMFLEMTLRFRHEISKTLALAKNLPLVWGTYMDYSQLVFTLLDYSIEAMKLSDKRELFVATEFADGTVCLDIRYSGTAPRPAAPSNSVLCILNLLKKKYTFGLSVQEQFGNTTFSLRVPIPEN